MAQIPYKLGFAKPPTRPTGASPGSPVIPSSTFVRTGDGAVSRTALQRRNSDEVYVSDFMTQAQLDEAIAGTLLTDMAPAIQDAIDYAIYQGSSGKIGLAKVIMPAGQFRTNDTVHLGYGTSFTSVILEGQGAKATRLVCMFSDRPGIVVHGGRKTCVRDLALLGLNQQHLVTLLAGISDADVDPANWVDPALHANAASRWAPYVGVAIDPYCGSPAAQQYPAVAYPSFLGAVAQYNKNFSSQTRLENVEITGFVVGVLNQVGDATGNGDYTKIDKCEISYCQYGVSVCNTQARLTEILSSAIVVCHTGIVTTKHGRQSGKPSIRVSGCELGICIKMLDVPNTSAGGGPQFDYCYGEGLYSIGNVGSVASNTNSTEFNVCEFIFGLAGIGVPAYTFEYSGTGFVTFNGCTFKREVGRIGFFGSAKSYRFIANNVFTEFEATALYQKFALNATCGVTFADPTFGLTTNLSAFSARVSNRYNLDTGAAVGSYVYADRGGGTRTRCICAYTKTITAEAPGDEGRDEGFPMVPYSAANNNGITKSGLSFATAGRDVTVTLTGRTTAQFALDGPDVGDVVWDRTSGAIFYVRSRTGAEIIMRAQTGFDAAGNLLVAMTTADALWTLNSRKFTLPYPTYGDTTAASAVMSNVARGDGDVSYLEEELTTSDFFYVVSRHDAFLPVSTPSVSARSEAGNSITAAGNFARTEVRKRLKLFVRAAAPNA